MIRASRRRLSFLSRLAAASSHAASSVSGGIGRSWNALAVTARPVTGPLQPVTRPVGRVVVGVARRPEAGIGLVLILICVYLSLVTPNFSRPDNLWDIVRNYSDIGISSLGMTLVLITGGIDLSVGSIMAFAGLACAWGMVWLQLPVPLAILLGLGAGALIGLVNGVLIQWVKLPPFIATLGMLGVTRGIVVGTTNGQVVRPFPDSFTNIGQGYVGFIPIPAIVLIFMAIIMALFLAYHLWGTYTYSIGGNETSALLTGLPVGRVKVFVYVMSGLLSGLAGVLVVARLGVSAPTQANGYELNVIAAAVIGGVSLQGGRGTILGAVLGTLIIGVLYNALVMLNVPTYWQQAFIGGIIILAAFIDRLRQRRA